MNKKINRHNDEISDVREEQAQNSQFFTFYMNNADNDDLKAEIVQLGEMVAKHKGENEKEAMKIKQDNEKDKVKIEKLKNLMAELKEVEIAMDGRITNVNSAIDGVI